MKHIDLAKIVDRFEGKLDPEDVSLVDEHVVKCAECSAVSRKLAHLFAYTAPVESEAVPQATTARILNIYQRKPARAESNRTEGRGLVSLLFDDWQTAVNERYSGIESRQLLFQVDEYQVDLRIEFSGEFGMVAGQIFPAIPNAIVELSEQDRRISAELSELGEFVFDAVPKGSYDLRIASEDSEIFIDQVPIQQ